MPSADADRKAGAARSWLAVLAATMLLQAVSAFLLRMAPTIAPFLTAEAGLSAGAIGYLTAVSTVGSIGFLLAGAPLIRRVGSIRTLQFGAVAAMIGALLLAVPQQIAIMAAVLLIGIGYGPSPGAGSDILQRYAPADRRSLIFSIKQAGVPIGGVLAGLMLPPAVAAFGIWGAIGCCVVISITAIALVQPLRAEIDAGRNATASVSLASVFAGENLTAPFRAVTGTPALFRLALAGMCFSLCQGTWFAFLVTYLVVKLGYSLALAGFVFAVTQATGIAGRIVLGWAADRVGSGTRVLFIAGMASAATSAAMALTDATWPTWAIVALAGLSGVAVSSWNGVQIAEMVRIAPGEIHTTVAGATAIVFLGYMIGPPLFALLLDLTGRFDLGFLAVGVIGLCGALLVGRARR